MTSRGQTAHPLPSQNCPKSCLSSRVRANAPSPNRCFTLPRGGDREQPLSIGCTDEVGSFLKNMGMKSSKVPLFLTRYHEFEKSQVFLRFRLGLFALFSLSLPRKHAPLPYPVTLSSRAPLARQTMLFGRSLFSERVYNPILPRFALPSCFSMEKLSASNIAYRTRLSWQTMHKRASKKKRPILLHCGPCPKNDVRRNRPTFLQLTPKRGRLLKT